MKTLIAITPNPALDLSGTVKNLKPNEKSYVFEEQRAPGGNAINCARILNRLDIPVLASGFLGGATGEEIRTLLEKEKLKHHFIPIKNSTRINITVSNLRDHQQTRLSFPGPNIQSDEKKSLLEFIKSQKTSSILIIGGSLPAGFTPQDLFLLIRQAKNQGFQVVVDCPGTILSKVLTAKPLLIKPNLEEFQALTHTRVRSLSSVIREARKLLPQISMICISSVEGGAVLVTKEGAVFGRIPRIKIQSTVGAGDSMVGAMVACLAQEVTSPEDVLRWGLAAAAATLSEKGTTLGRASEIVRYYKKTKVQKILFKTK